MKLMLTYFTLVLQLLSCKANTSAIPKQKAIEVSETPQNIDKYIGKWEYVHGNDKTKPSLSFSLILEKDGSNDNIKGRYCSVAEGGNKIDCSTDKTEYNINGKLITDSSIEINFYSFWDNSTGRAIVVLKSDGLMIWKIVQKPDGTYYCPDMAVLRRHTENASSSNTSIQKPNFQTFVSLFPIISLPINLSPLMTFDSIYIKERLNTNPFYSISDHEHEKAAYAFGQFSLHNNITALLFLYDYKSVENEDVASKVIEVRTYDYSGMVIDSLQISGLVGNEGSTDSLSSTIEYNAIDLRINKRETEVSAGIVKLEIIKKVRRYIIDNKGNFILK